jgi:hypothetical protein
LGKDFTSLKLSVVIIDHQEVLVENAKPVHVLSFRFVVFAEVGFPFLKGNLLRPIGLRVNKKIGKDNGGYGQGNKQSSKRK